MSLTLDKFMEYTEISPVIAAIKNEDALSACKKLDTKLIYILYGNLCDIPQIVEEIKAMKKKAIVHLDLITGLGSKEVCVDFIKNSTRADGIISTKPHLIKRANELDLFTIQRFFMIDYITYSNIAKHVKATEPDIVELLPAGLSKVIKYLSAEIDRPIVASGLILDEDDVMGALKSGAVAVSTTNQDLWEI